jgi:hypothetical protein
MPRAALESSHRHRHIDDACDLQTIGVMKAKPN